MSWFVYMLECVDGSLYTGIATDVVRRFDEHASGRGARYTRARPPRTVVMVLEQPDRSAALKAEYAIKQLSAVQKRTLAAQNPLADAMRVALGSRTER
ncbi:Predicted endonuclease, GIY-YIG superfamily [Andreprevotia lacus DSM 23236]|jgi:putative endonuclease|uniref:Predicted endonuclease, GIY-YIG superfamily n=1 Tax=Andreprevotia lacus DSM 23236 TaxID=1121001 RepID=A0A1W1XIG6_9NEIS|nr:GIY-YIG nuclease family protein [Andreprevotia lacus]SMC23759.1 Predicted endonuclease, GIY-YIG superfamily [Andreprevotia lacus DSM 23236]